MDRKIKVGDLIEFYGYSVSCEDERERYEKGLCPAKNDERHLKVGEIYEVVRVNDTDYGLFCDIQGKGKNGDNIVVSGTSVSNFKLVEINNKNNKTMKITNLIKKIVDKDTRELIEGGFINGELQRSDEGTSELLDLLFLEKKDELVKILKKKKEENK